MELSLGLGIEGMRGLDIWGLRIGNWGL